DRLRPAENVPDEPAAHHVGRPGRAVVDAGRLEGDALVGPAHRPVDLPYQLAAGELGQLDRGRVPAGAGVGHHRRLVVVRGDRRQVAVARLAVRLVRGVGRRRGAVVLIRGTGAGQRELVHRGLVGRQAGGGGSVPWLGAVLRQDRVDAVPLTHREQHLV